MVRQGQVSGKLTKSLVDLTIYSSKRAGINSDFVYYLLETSTTGFQTFPDNPSLTDHTVALTR